ncbi:hypothetical protein ACOSQ2_029617 [Xanthoceras sorbifolium]
MSHARALFVCLHFFESIPSIKKNYTNTSIPYFYNFTHIMDFFGSNITQLMTYLTKYRIELHMDLIFGIVSMVLCSVLKNTKRYLKLGNSQLLWDWWYNQNLTGKWCWSKKSESGGALI